ncbi:MAG TPA: single-stranded-DNA-specific exonuclease RecJ [Crocinitomicaceae bacterium]|nr:single-stranded-DNA-specific exonuclease RecJ [Crocinitomicaceae bacterium]
MQKRWQVKTPKDTTLVEEFRSTLKVDPIVAELLLQREITSFNDAQAFFRPSLDDLHDPFLMHDMEEAVERLQTAIDEQQRVMLFGDYDVDGTTAVALMYSFLKDTLPLDFYIPDRYKEGYGLSKIGVDVAKKNEVDLIISLDCGIKSIEEVAYAKSLGIDFIICDHHTPGESLPDAIVLDPKRKDCEYPYKELSGCGVGFKLLQGLCYSNNWGTDKLFESLDLLAVSIGADIVHVTGENRILSYHGMKRLNEQPRLAFRELFTLAKKEFPVTLTDVIFSIAPRINAAGRLRSGRYSVELMISEDRNEIHQLATEINEDNLERRELDKQITEEALAQIDQDETAEKRFSNVVFSENWHKGVVGIVASRIIEKHYKPTIVLTQSNGLITGSARSIKGFDVYEGLLKCEDLLEQFGGHTFAAGMTLKPENLEAFKKRFEEVASEKLTKELMIEEQIIDVELSFNQIFGPEENRMKVPRLKRIISQFEPHGPENMKPVFISKNVYSTDVRVLKDAHLKLTMIQPEFDVVIEGIGFNMAEKKDIVASGLPFDIVYTLEINRWRDRETIQMNIKDIRETV